MTREEAIQALNEIFDDSDFSRYESWYGTAMNMAIEALSAEAEYSKLLQTALNGIPIVDLTDGKTKPSAEIPTESTNTPTNTPTDLISRADAINTFWEDSDIRTAEVRATLKALPSAELPKGELISRADAIGIIEDNIGKDYMTPMSRLLSMQGKRGRRMITYHKIETIFKRDEQGTKRLIPYEWRDPTVEFLRDCEWVWTEKVDGTNIGIYWDGHAVHFQGRTEKANIPKPLLEKLEELFGGEANEQLFEQLFGEKEVVLFGEGYGNKIQKSGADYNPDGVDFILFDVYVGGIYLERLNVEDIGRAFNIDVIPIVGKGTLVEAIHFVQSEPKSTIGNAAMEGVVARPTVEVKNRKGERIIVKIKVKDFKGLEV